MAQAVPTGCELWYEGYRNATCNLLHLHQAHLLVLRSYDTISMHTELYEVKHSKFISTCWPANSSKEASLDNMCRERRNDAMP